MGCTVRELQERMSSAEFSEWMAYYQIEPWGEERADVRSAILAALTANIHRGKRAKRYKVQDFLAVPPRRELDTNESIEAKLRAFTKQMGGTING